MHVEVHLAEHSDENVESFDWTVDSLRGLLQNYPQVTLLMENPGLSPTQVAFIEHRINILGETPETAFYHLATGEAHPTLSEEQQYFLEEEYGLHTNNINYQLTRLLEEPATEGRGRLRIIYEILQEDDFDSIRYQQLEELFSSCARNYVAGDLSAARDNLFAYVSELATSSVTREDAIIARVRAEQQTDPNQAFVVTFGAAHTRLYQYLSNHTMMLDQADEQGRIWYNPVQALTRKMIFKGAESISDSDLDQAIVGHFALGVISRMLFEEDDILATKLANKFAREHFDQPGLNTNIVDQVYSWTMDYFDRME